MAQYSHFRRPGTNLKSAGVSPQVAWYGIATILSCRPGTRTDSELVMKKFHRKNRKVPALLQKQSSQFT